MRADPSESRIPRGVAQSKSGLVISVCALVTVLEGLDLQSAGVAAPRLASAFHMVPSLLGWFFSLSTFGMMFGAAIGGWLSDRLGRKRVLLAAVVLFGAMSLACGLVQSVPQLFVARFVTGVGLGAALPTLVALVVEVSPASRRSVSIGLLHAGLPIGGAIASVIMSFVPVGDWRVVFVVGGLSPLALLPLLALVVPAYRATAVPVAIGDRPASTAVWPALFGEGRAAVTLLTWSAFLCTILFPYLLLYWLPTLMLGRGLSQAASFSVQTAFGLSGAFGSLLTGTLMDRLPRTAVVAAIFTLLLLALCLLAFAPAQLALSLMAGGLAGMAVAGAQASVYALAPMAYPGSVRGTGVGIALSVGRIGAAGGPLLAAAMIGGGASPQQVLVGLTPIALLGGIAAFSLARLTAGQRRPHSA